MINNMNNFINDENDINVLFQLANNNDKNQKYYIEKGLSIDPNNILLKACSLKYTDKYLNDILNLLDNIDEKYLGYIYNKVSCYYKNNKIKSKYYLNKSIEYGYLISYLLLHSWFNINIDKYKNDILEFMIQNKLNINIDFDFAYYYEYIEINYNEMKKYCEKEINKGNSNAMCNLGHYYQHIEENYELMKKYYELAIEHNNSNAMYNLGLYYENVEKNYELMKKYFLMAIKHGNSHAIFELGLYYHFTEKNYKLMKIYYNLEIERGNDNAMCYLGYYYQKIEKNYELMKKYYEMAIGLNNSNAMYNLGVYYQYYEKNNNKMKKYYISALLNGFIQYNNISNKIIIDAIINYNYEYKGDDDILENIYNKIVQFNNLGVIKINECNICYEINELKQFNDNLLCKSCYIKN